MPQENRFNAGPMKDDFMLFQTRVIVGTWWVVAEDLD
jgi:hypothetical protein